MTYHVHGQHENCEDCDPCDRECANPFWITKILTLSNAIWNFWKKRTKIKIQKTENVNIDTKISTNYFDSAQWSIKFNCYKLFAMKSTMLF